MCLLGGVLVSVRTKESEHVNSGCVLLLGSVVMRIYRLYAERRTISWRIGQKRRSWPPGGSQYL